jgi:PPOX class probable F420-dependent enzyme
MTLVSPAAAEFLAGHNRGVLTTLKRDGRPQLSNVVYHFLDGVVRISATEGRAKTLNARRDPRVALHVTTPEFRPYLVAEGEAEVSAVSGEPGDEIGRWLAEIYEGAAGRTHPDWDEFYRAMVDEQRLVLSFAVTNTYGMLG